MGTTTDVPFVVTHREKLELFSEYKPKLNALDIEKLSETLDIELDELLSIMDNDDVDFNYWFIRGLISIGVL